VTPEGKVKREVNKLIDRYEQIYKFMPVPFGYGPSSLDYILCVVGAFVAIETKVSGQSPTPRQMMTIKQIQQSGGVVFIVDGPDSLRKLEIYFESACKRKAQAPGDTADRGVTRRVASSAKLISRR
jgi:hypothetical protein